MHTHTHAKTYMVLFFFFCPPLFLLLSFHPLTLAICISQDAFFYSLVYDPQQKTLLADKGEIRVGNKFQADITDLLKEGKS